MLFFVTFVEREMHSRVKLLQRLSFNGISMRVEKLAITAGYARSSAHRVEPVFDPFSLSAAALLLGRLFATHRRRSAQQRNNAAKIRVRQLQDELTTASEALSAEIVELAQTHGAAVTQVLRKSIQLARRLGLKRRAFNSSDGWFGLRSYKELNRYIDAIDEYILAIDLYARSPQVRDGDIGPILSAALKVVQGVSYFELIFQVQTPGVHTSFHDILAALPLDGAADLADGLGPLGGLDLGDLMGAFVFVWSIFSIFNNLSTAAEYDQESEEVEKVIREAEIKLRELKVISERAIAIKDARNRRHSSNTDQFGSSSNLKV